jgi:hypothetical protein
VLQADGIAISSSYGAGPDASELNWVNLFYLATYTDLQTKAYVGDDRYDPIWAELHRRKAVVFLHGAQVPASTPIQSPTLCIPITEVYNPFSKI